MNLRRRILIAGGVTAVVAAVSRIREQDSWVYRKFGSNVTSLNFPEVVLTPFDESEVFSRLRKKGVINDQGRISSEVLQRLAADEEMLIYQDAYYTQSELEVYALVWYQKRV